MRKLFAFSLFVVSGLAQAQDSHRADGLILLGYGDYTMYERKLEQLVRQGTHFVRWGSVRGDNIGATVGSDNFGAGRLVGEHLLAIGRSRVAFLGDADARYPEFADRYGGLCAALRDAGVAPDSTLQKHALTSEKEGYDAARELLASGAQFDALFAAWQMLCADGGWDVDLLVAGTGAERAAWERRAAGASR